MSFKAYDKQADIPEGIREHYQEVHGMWLPEVDEVTVGEARYAFQDIAGLKNTVSTLRTEVDGHKRKLKAYDGIEDPGAALTAMATLAELGDPENLTDKAKAALVKNQAVADLQAKHVTEKTAWGEERTSLHTEVQRLGLDAEVDRLLAGVDRAKVLRPHLTRRLRCVRDEATGRFDTKVLKPDLSGVQISMKADDDGDMKPGELFESFKTDPDFKDFFPGTPSVGIKARTTTKGGGGSDTTENNQEDVGPVERLKQARRELAAQKQ